MITLNITAEGSKVKLEKVKRKNIMDMLKDRLKGHKFLLEFGVQFV